MMNDQCCGGQKGRLASLSTKFSNNCRIRRRAEHRTPLLFEKK